MKSVAPPTGIVTEYDDDRADEPGALTWTVSGYGTANAVLTVEPVTIVGPVTLLLHRYTGAATYWLS
jgi:hypothetical protein